MTPAPTPDTERIVVRRLVDETTKAIKAFGLIARHPSSTEAIEALCRTHQRLLVEARDNVVRKAKAFTPPSDVEPDRRTTLEMRTQGRAK